jgi:aromatic ring-opening dioxygenase catalytic subunit (LigB family)
MGPGLDHGVFVPFKLMFGDSADIPVVQVSLDGSLDPAKEWALGQAVSSLRYVHCSSIGLLGSISMLTTAY